MSLVENSANLINKNLSEKCPICLEEFEDMVILNRCFHCFCRICIIQWIEYEPLKISGIHCCPLCRSPFSSLINLINANSSLFDLSYLNKPSIGNIVDLRRRTVYALNLYPIIEEDFQIINPWHQGINEKSNQINTLKMNSWLKRDLPVVLNHEIMPFTSDSSQKQVEEISIISLFIASFIASIFEDLYNWVKTYKDCFSLIDQKYIFTLLPPENQGIIYFQDKIRPFFAHQTEKFVREFIIFMCMPFKLQQFDLKVKYFQI